MSKRFEPYNFDSFTKVLQKAFNDGGYGGRKKHFILTCEGEFEGWSGRATEGWETHFTLETPRGKFEGETVDQVFSEYLKREITQHE